MSSLYYQDFEIGQKFVSPGRTVTETDSTLYCMMSGDWNPMHTDAVYAKTTHFGQRVVQGTFGFALFTGMTSRWGIFNESARGLLSIEEWKFLNPIFIGDTVHVEMEIQGKRLTSKPDRGVLQRRFKIIKQDGVVAQDGRAPMLIAVRP